MEVKMSEKPEYAIVKKDMIDNTIPAPYRPKAGEQVKIIWVDESGTALIESARHTSPMRLFMPEANLLRVARING